MSTTWALYGSGADKILLRHEDKIGYLRFQLDRHGNVAFLVDNDGQVLEKYTYDAFGRATVTDWEDTLAAQPRSSSNYGHRFLFQGREYLHEVGIYDYRNRYYYAALGRFLQSDPTGFDGGDMNLFRYCGDDPVDLSDPTGLFAGFANMIGALRENWIGADGLTADARAQGEQRDDAAGMNRQARVAPVVTWKDVGNRNLHEPVVRDKVGKSYTALTEPALVVKVEKGVIIVYYIMNVRYSDDVGKHNREKQALEKDHANEIDKEFRYDRGPKIIERLSRPGGPLEKHPLETARWIVDHSLRTAFDSARDDSHARHDNTNPLLGPIGDHVIKSPLGLKY